MITGEDQFLVDLKRQTFCHDTDVTLMTALSEKFAGVMESRDPVGSAKLPGQGPIRLTKYWPEVKDYLVTSLPRPMAGSIIS